jgi:hypothetical protein
MNIRKFASYSQLFVILTVLIIAGCTEDPLKVGLELIPTDDLLNAKVDTIALECYTVEGYPGLVNSETADNAPIGNVIDPVFGDSWSDVTMKFMYNSAYEKENKSTSPDSLISCKLYLNIDNDQIYGGPAGFDVNIYPLKKLISYSHPTNYLLKSDEYFFENSPVSARTTHMFQAMDDTTIEGIDSGKYYLIVEINKAYADKLLNTDNYTSETVFDSIFPGFFLQSQAITEKGGMNNFYYKSSLMVLEYNRTYQNIYGVDSAVATKNTTFGINYYNCFYRHTSNNSPDGAFGNFLNDTINQQSTFNIQSLGGVRGYIKIPSLDALKAKSDSIGINFAELVFPINEEFADTVDFFNSKRLTLMVKKTNDGEMVNLDEDSRNASYFNGYFNKTKMEYRLNITEYIHKYISGDLTYDRFYLMAAKYGNDVPSVLEYKVPGRVVLNSGLNSKPSILRVIYTKTNQ